MTLKLRCRVERLVGHGERVYTLTLRPERPVPPFRAGQFLHLALDSYDRGGFWPDSRVFSIASSPHDRQTIRITYAVHGRFTQRMERELAEGGDVWIKLPYGDFTVEPDREVALFAGGTGVTAFTAFLETLGGAGDHPVTLAYGARSTPLLIYREAVERCRRQSTRLNVLYFVERAAAGDDVPPEAVAGRVSVQAVWDKLRTPVETAFYISGPPPMLRGIADDLKARSIAPEAIHIDAWE